MEKTKKLEKKDGFMKGVLALMFSQVLIKILGLVSKIYLTNKEGFGDIGNGIYASGYQIYAMLLTISSIGVPNAISKLISERVAIDDYKGAHRIFRIALLTFGLIGLTGTLILFFGAGAIANSIEVPEAMISLQVLSPSITFVTIASVLRGYFNGLDKVSVTAKSQSLEQLFKTVITILAVHFIGMLTNNQDTTLMAAGANLATTLSVLLSFLYILMYYRSFRKVILPKIKQATNYKYERIKKIVRNILIVSIPITLSAIMSTLSKIVDIVTVVKGLKTFLPDAIAKAQYGILSGKVDTLATLPLSFNIAFATALVPSVSGLMAKGDNETAGKRISLSLLITMLIGLPCTFGMMVFAQPIINLLFPNATEGGFLLQIFSLTIIFAVLMQTTNGALQGLGRIIVPAITSFIGVMFKLILNLVLVPNPEFGVNGAAIASVVNNFVAFLLSFIVLRKTIKLNLNFSKFILKPGIATLAMCICSYYIYTLLLGIISSKIATILGILVAVIIYVVMVIILRVFDEEEITMIPYGNKIYKMLKRLGIYGKENN